MRILTNDTLIARRARIGNILVMTGLVSLVIALITNFLTTSNPGTVYFVYISLAAMLIGLITTMIGGPIVRRFGRPPRADQIIADATKGFDDRYHLYAWTLPADLVLVGPSGVFTFVVNTIDGKISGKGDRLQQSRNFWRILTFFGREGLGDPVREARADAERMTEFIRKEAPGFDIVAQPIVVFAHKQVILDIDSPSIPIVTPKMLKGLLRGPGKMVVSERVRKPLVEALDRASGPASNKKVEEAD